MHGCTCKMMRVAVRPASIERGDSEADGAHVEPEHERGGGQGLQVLERPLGQVQDRRQLLSPLALPRHWRQAGKLIPFHSTYIVFGNKLGPCVHFHPSQAA